ncbi:hypothetical protein TRFO_16479 [Tritrichomonas foetus]|uniref:Uncharacterized protein n=1 Tax=Tritrichomonas foetus TaxID=1144522 RepID=A0A1J4KR30_9EUKA|nr:hypothetical protein TRFO_16479 [Tritrichomonas foetus]|eukprot:OHT13384.1 hypothetical protein TRFO_16479 [Tritrichomonas foetus]
MSDLDNSPVGSDADLNEAIKIVLATNGFEANDPEIINLVEIAIRKKLELITANVNFYAKMGQDNSENKFLQLSDLKQALNEEKIKIDRPEFILQQSQTKNTSRRKPK